MTNPRIVEFHWQYLDSAAELYAYAYAVQQAPETELGPTGFSREVIVQHALRDSFLGVLAVDEQERVLGFAWGYASPNKPSRLTELVHKRLGTQWTEDTFVMEAFAIHPGWQGEAMEDALVTALTHLAEDAKYQRVRTRLERARMDALPATLHQQGWQELNSLAHVVWYGKQL
ncbi:MAG: hypothetical protein HC915_14705 [Anaerolineae bacterium]|nr:hypothetical protein [Anaerolineae bacterium]